ncbi:hypothetical protein TrVFT333_007003 [Trichoderma virens FT-333]|nr:hypothetical protein TrVFT333_007003 [Trichoderma virens FT-333]
MDNEGPSAAMTSDEILFDIRQRSIRCAALLQNLSNEDSTDTAEARVQMARFNTWAVDTGVFCEAQLQSIDSLSKRHPEISEGIQQTLSKLECTLVKNESQQPMSWENIDQYIDVLYQPFWLSYGHCYRTEQNKRLKSLSGNKELYELYESCARQKIDRLIPNASAILRERMAESIATRRIRFLFLEQHREKTSTLGEPATALKKQEPEPMEGENAQVAPPAVHQVATGDITPIKRNPDPSTQPSVVLSPTVVKLEVEKSQPTQDQHVKFVSSAKYSTAMGASFTCPYCFLVCPLDEASRPGLGHLIHDFEPLFCTFETCSSPFMYATKTTYDKWFDHMLHGHTKSQWRCWLFGMTPKPLLEECPFCGEFPAELEKAYPDQKSDQAYKALVEHIRDHLFRVAMDSISS